MLFLYRNSLGHVEGFSDAHFVHLLRNSRIGPKPVNLIDKRYVAFPFSLKSELSSRHFSPLCPHSRNGPKVYEDTFAFFVIQEKSGMCVTPWRHISIWWIRRKLFEWRLFFHVLVIDNLPELILYDSTHRLNISVCGHGKMPLNLNVWGVAFWDSLF